MEAIRAKQKRRKDGRKMSLKPPIRPEWEAPTQEVLVLKALKFFKECKPKEYREMKKDGSLQEVCELRAEGARRYAENLILGGMFGPAAWNMAVRLEILESESD